MREYSFKINEKMLNGLRVHYTNPRNSGSLVNCMNILPTEYGLLPYETATSLFENDYYYDLIPPVDWPFPQMLIGPTYAILCFKTKIYSLNIINGIEIDTLIYNFGDQPTWDGTNTWHFADFHHFIVITNGEIMLYRDPENNLWKVLYINNTMPMMGTVCNFRGQLIGGNISSDWYGCTNNSVIWSDIGSINMIPSNSNMAGFMPMSFPGIIHKVLPLGNNIIIYGESGIAALSSSELVFGLKILSTVGVIGRDAIFGDDNRHLFIDESGLLKSITPDLIVDKIGYQEFFSPMAGDEVNISYDNSNDRYYISNGTDNYIFTKDGMGTGYQVISSGEFNQGAFVGNIKVTPTYDLEYRIKLDTFDIGYRGQKTIESIEIGSDQSSDCYVSIDYRFAAKDAWQTTREVICNNEGIVKLPCAGIEFRFNLRFTSYTNVNLDYIDVKYKATDKRTDRGVKHAIANAS